MMRPRRTTAYLQIGPDGRSSYGMPVIVKRFTNSKPRNVLPGCIVVKVEIVVPGEAWEPFSPSAVIEVPLELIQRPIVVEAVDPS